MLNRHKSRIWSLEGPNETRKLVRDIPIVNLWYGTMHDKIIGSFFFTKKSSMTQIFFYDLTEYTALQLEKYQKLEAFPVAMKQTK